MLTGHFLSFDFVMSSRMVRVESEPPHWLFTSGKGYMLRVEGGKDQSERSILENKCRDKAVAKTGLKSGSYAPPCNCSTTQATTVDSSPVDEEYAADSQASLGGQG